MARQVQGVQIGVSTASMIYVLAAGQILYASHVRITTEISSLVLADFEMMVRWDPNISPADEPYIFGPRRRLKFDLEETLNHRLLHTIRLEPRVTASKAGFWELAWHRFRASTEQEALRLLHCSCLIPPDESLKGVQPFRWIAA